MEIYGAIMKLNFNTVGDVFQSESTELICNMKNETFVLLEELI